MKNPKFTLGYLAVLPVAVVLSLSIGNGTALAGAHGGECPANLMPKECPTQSPAPTTTDQGVAPQPSQSTAPVSGSADTDNDAVDNDNDADDAGKGGGTSGGDTQQSSGSTDDQSTGAADNGSGGGGGGGDQTATQSDSPSSSASDNAGSGSQLPDTGPAAAFGGVAGAGSIGYASYMYLRSKRGVKDALKRR